MNIRDLQYLVAIDKFKHFSDAAESCFVSQPALSMQLQKLENTLGVKLIERTTKSVMLTPVGEEIVAISKNILVEIDDIKTAALNAQDPFTGDIKLGALPTIAPFLLPKVTRTISTTLPNIRLLLVEEKNETLVAMLHNGELDCAILALPIEHTNIEYVKLFEDPFYLAVPQSHPLSKRKRIRQSEITSESLLLLSEGHCLRDQALKVCNLMDTADNQDFRATSIETLRQMVASGIGITLIPKIAQKDTDGLAYIPFEKPSPSRTIALVWRTSSPRTECMNTIANVIKTIV